jgi:thymidylate synthase
MQTYHDLLTRILNEGVQKEDRTGTGTLSVFGDTRRYDLSAGFPLVTTKKVHWKSVVYELLWFIKGDTNIKYLNDNGVTIWNEWADADGNLGRVYGAQWRRVRTPSSTYLDQLAWIIGEIRKNPNSRRLIVNSWNAGEVYGKQCALPPCHVLYQFNVTNGRLSCMLYQRSGDAFLGVPFNIASYALLTSMIAQICGLQVGELIHTIADAHIYLNHIEQVELQLRREPYPLPMLRLNPSVLCIDDFKYEDVELVNYVHHRTIKAPVAI